MSYGLGFLSEIGGGIIDAGKYVWDTAKTAGGYIVDHAGDIGTLLGAGATVYSAFNQPKAPELPSAPSLPTLDASSISSDAAKAVNSAGSLDLSASPTVSDNYQSILDQATAASNQFKLENGTGSALDQLTSDSQKVTVGDTSASDTTSAATTQKDAKRKQAIRADVSTDKNVWDSYAPISYKTLLGGV